MAKSKQQQDANCTAANNCWYIANFDRFLPAQRYASAGTSYDPVSVCLCLCPSVTS